MDCTADYESWRRCARGGSCLCASGGLCADRHRHADRLTAAMRAEGLVLTRCPCGLLAATRPNAERN